MRITITTRQWFLVAVIAIPIGIFVAFHEINSPEYYETQGDPEHLAYYNTKLVANGMAPQGDKHPGNPIFIVFAPLMVLVGDSVNSTGLFLRITHVIIASATIIALSVLVIRLSNDYGELLAFASAVSIVAWPSFLGHTVIFISTGVIAPLAILFVALYHRPILGFDSISKSSLLIAVIILGTLLAIKLTTIGLVGLGLVGLSLGPYIYARQNGVALMLNEVAARLMMSAGGVLLMFAIWTSSTFQRWPDLVLGTALPRFRD